MTTELISAREAAEFLGVSEGTLSVWRSTKRYRLPWVKVGGLVRYRPSDLSAFISSRVVNGDEKPVRRNGARSQSVAPTVNRARRTA